MCPSRHGLLCVWSAAQDNAARTVNGAVDYFFLGIRSVYHITVSGVDCHMADIQVAVVYFKGVKDQIAGARLS